jgi:hypothetical protein
MRSSIRLLAGFIAGLIAVGAARAESLPRFPAAAPWYQDISNAPLASSSSTMVSTWNAAGGFGIAQFSIGFTLYVLHAPPGTPTQPVIEAVASSYALPDCDPLGTPVPLPPGGAIENSVSQNYTCDNANERCRLLVVSGTTLYELREANVVPGGVQSLCLATWNLARTYPPQNRGDQCIAASTSGMPIAPLLLNADEVFAALQRPDEADRHVGHALMIYLPSASMANDPAFSSSGRLFVRPASNGGSSSGPPGSVPFGARVRLRPDFPFANYNPAAQVVLRTLQKYGVVIGGTGNVIVQAERDTFTTHKWNEAAIALAPGAFTTINGQGGLPVTAADFQVVDTGARMPVTFDCVRELLLDGFE